MTYYETKIGKIIEEEFDSRMGNAVISYIMDKGMSNVKEITDEQIKKFEGNGLMTQDFVQSLVRCARRICVECEWAELIEFIRLHLWCTPTVHMETMETIGGILICTNILSVMMAVS